MDKVNEVFGKLDDWLGPKKGKYQEACYEDKEMLLECVMSSACFRKHENFKYCMTEGIDKECKALRYDHTQCRRAQLFWIKSFSRDDAR